MSSVLLLHGAGGGDWEWSTWSREFVRRGYSVDAPNLVPRPQIEDTTLDDYVGQAMERPSAEVIVGASMGAIIALKVAEMLKPKALVLVCPVPPGEIHPGGSKVYPPLVRWAGTGAAETRRALPDGDESMVQLATSLWRDESGQVLNTLGQVKVSPPTWPCLIVHGTGDREVPTDAAIATARWASADLHLYHGMSHLGPLLGRRVEAVARITADWISTAIA